MTKDFFWINIEYNRKNLIWVCQDHADYINQTITHFTVVCEDRFLKLDKK